MSYFPAGSRGRVERFPWLRIIMFFKVSLHGGSGGMRTHTSEETGALRWAVC